MARDLVYRQPFRKNLRRLYDYLDRKLADSAEGAAANGAVATEKGCGAIHKTILTLDDVAIAMADNAGVVAYGSKKLYDFPAGLIQVLGCVVDVDLVRSSNGINAQWDGDVGVGSAAADNTDTLSSTEQDIVPTTSIPQAVAGVATARAVATGGVYLNGTVTPADLYLNLLIDDSDHDVTGTPANLVATGTIEVTWINHGAFA